MNLLPKDHKDFSTKEYWNDFFKKQKSHHFEWYGEYDTLGEVLDKYIKTKDKLLIIGCGNSKLSADLYDVGICNSISIDIDPLVINQMKEKYGKDRLQMVFEVMDVFELSYENDAFAVVLDKGTLDALLVDESQETMEKINKMFSEIERVLRYGGRYLCVSLLQEHVVRKLLDWFLEKGWLIRVQRCIKAESKHLDSLAFPVFLVVLTKMKQIQNSSMILEIVHSGVDAPKRCSSQQEVLEYVKSSQHYSFLKYYLHKKKLPDDDICLELCCPHSGEVKYRMFVVDRTETASTKFAIFIVPQGRETEWLFSTPEGRRELAASANAERLIVVHLQRNSIYKTLEDVKKDISDKILELAPLNFKSQVPILSLGGEVGKREIKYSSKSDISGDFVVEDVLSEDNDLFRRLIFLNNPYVVQSEAKLMTGQKKKKKKGVPKLEIDFTYLACDHHAAIISGLAFLKTQMLNPKILQIGLGGGTLVMYLFKHFPQADIEVVELDPEIVDVAKKWFNVATDERLKINICDGIIFLQEASQKELKYDAVILDVDGKDPSLGISSPPIGFLETCVLKNLVNVVHDSGVVMMNLACRNAELHREAYSKLKATFKCIFSRKIPNEVNEILYCMKNGNVSDIQSFINEHYTNLVSFLEEQTKCTNVFDTADLASSLNDIT